MCVLLFQTSSMLLHRWSPLTEFVTYLDTDTKQTRSGKRYSFNSLHCDALPPRGFNISFNIFSFFDRCFREKATFWQNSTDWLGAGWNHFQRNTLKKADNFIQYIVREANICYHLKLGPQGLIPDIVKWLCFRSTTTLYLKVRLINLCVNVSRIVQSDTCT